MAKRIELTEDWPGYPAGTIMTLGRDGRYTTRDGILKLSPDAVEERVEGGAKVPAEPPIKLNATSLRRIADG